jgi:hypothetical protein
MDPIWKKIPSTNGRYEASTTGHIRNAGNQRELKPYFGHGKYLVVKVCPSKNIAISKRIHELVTETFFGDKPESFETNHIDGDKNNNSISNLEYLSKVNHIKHGVENGFVMRGEENPRATLTFDQVKKIKEIRSETGFGKRKISQITGIKEETIGPILRGISWRYV